MSDQPARPSLSTNPDEAPGGARRPTGARKGRAAERGPEVESQTRAGVASGPVLGLFGLAIAGLLVAGWFIFAQQRALAESEAQMAAARERIQALEERLNMTDASLNEAGESTSEKIDFWESEIRKLWDVVNKRNMDLIKGNSAGLARVDKAVAELDATVAEMNSAFGRYESGFARQEQMVDQITSLGAQLQQTQRALRDAIDRANAAQQSVAGLNSGLAKRVTETEQAVEAFDAYRLQVNGRLADIERRIGAPPL